MFDINLIGDLETAEGSERMVVRVLGHRVGTSDGWIHHDGWCVVSPDFIPEPAIEKFLKFPFSEDRKNLALVTDFYSGQLTLLSNVIKGGTPNDWIEVQSVMLGDAK